MKRISALFIGVLILFLAGCRSSSTSGDAPSGTRERTSQPSVTAFNDPYADLWARIDGSTATIPLTEGIMAHFLGLSAEEAALRVNHTKTSGAYSRLINKEVDLIFATSPAQDWLDYAAETGVELEVVPVVKDALVFLINRQNTVASLTQKQLIDIYTGKLTNWKDAGGSDAKIRPFQRPLSSGSQTLFLQLLMKEIQPTEATPDLEKADMSGLIDAVAEYDNAQSSLGYSVFYYATDMYANDNIRLLGVDGVVPSRDTIAGGDYPLITYYYAAIRKDTPENHPARQLLAWLLSAEGQRIADQAGYVPMERGGKV